MSIPALSIGFMGVSALLSVGVPIGLLIYLVRRRGAKVVPALTGAAAFVVFAMGLEQVLHLMVLKPAADGTIALKSQPVLFMLYGSFAAGIFEETARYLSFRLLRRKYKGIQTALSYGVGHGGIEAILIGGLSMTVSFVLSVAQQTGGLTALIQGAGGQAITTQLQALAEMPPYLFLMSGAERMLALVIQVSLSVLVFYSVYENRRFWLYPLAVLLHALVDAPAALMQAGVLRHVFVLEGMVLVSALLLAVLAVRTHRHLKPDGNARGADGGQTHEAV